MEYRVDDLLNLQSLKDAVVLTSQSYMNNSIKGITIMEAPDIADWLKGGELILTSLYPIRNFNRTEQKDFVLKLKEKEVSALVIKNKSSDTKISEYLVDQGNKFGLPIIQIPKEVPFVEIMYPVMGELFNRQVKKLQYYKEIHDRFTALSLADEGPEQIIKTLEMLIKNPVALFDRNYHCIVSTDPSLERFEIIEKIPYYEKTNEIKFPHYRQIVKYPLLEGQSGFQIVVPVETVNHSKTYLLISELNQPLEELDFIAVENAATSLSLELMKQFAVAEVEKKFKNDLIEELINGRIQSMKSIRQKANVIGWELDGSFVAVLFKITPSQKAAAVKQKNKDSYSNVSLTVVHDAIHQFLPDGIMTSKSNFVIVLWKVNKNGPASSASLDHIKKVAGDIQKLIKKQMRDIVVQVGVGNIADNILGISKSYKEAQEAIELGKIVFGEETITVFSELGLFRLLCNFHDVNSLSTYIPSSLNKLLNYPHANQPDLIKTLKIFLECNQNAAKTSQILFMHYKTVVYRIDRIKEITGMNFEDAEEMLSVQVGLKIINLLERENKIMKSL